MRTERQMFAITEAHYNRAISYKNDTRQICIKIDALMTLAHITGDMAFISSEFHSSTMGKSAEHL
jgi:hypothetical protein